MAEDPELRTPRSLAAALIVEAEQAHVLSDAAMLFVRTLAETDDPALALAVNATLALEAHGEDTRVDARARAFAAFIECAMSAALDSFIGSASPMLCEPVAAALIASREPPALRHAVARAVVSPPASPESPFATPARTLGASEVDASSAARSPPRSPDIGGPILSTPAKPLGPRFRAPKTPKRGKQIMAISNMKNYKKLSFEELRWIETSAALGVLILEYPPAFEPRPVTWSGPGLKLARAVVGPVAN
eukprot:Amastigsp_a342264_38.p1 type:complete len:248 gc:universal Amastigsp_a342264_38:896-153(-)